MNVLKKLKLNSSGEEMKFKKREGKYKIEYPFKTKNTERSNTITILFIKK